MRLCCLQFLACQNRTIGFASDFRVDGAKSPESPQKEGVSGSEIATRKSLRFRRTKLQLEASPLQLSFCVWEIFYLQLKLLYEQICHLSP